MTLPENGNKEKETMTSILGGNGENILEMFQICIEELFICQCLVTM